MSFDIGDFIELDIGKEFIVLSYCIINDLEYYLVIDKENINDTLVLQKKKDLNEIIIVKDKNVIEKVLNQIGNNEEDKV